MMPGIKACVPSRGRVDGVQETAGGTRGLAFCGVEIRVCLPVVRGRKKGPSPPRNGQFELESLRGSPSCPVTSIAPLTISMILEWDADAL